MLRARFAEAELTGEPGCAAKDRSMVIYRLKFICVYSSLEESAAA